MSFVEFQPKQSKPEPPDYSEANGLWIIFVLPIVFAINLCPPVARLFGQVTTLRKSENWLAEWKTARLACQYCGARVERFEFSGESVLAPPGLDGQLTPNGECALSTPVGAFLPRKGRWRRAHFEPAHYTIRGTFGAEDEQRGWYATELLDMSEAATAGYPTAVLHLTYRKADTPEDWCLLETENARWIDPRRLAAGVTAD